MDRLKEEINELKKEICSIIDESLTPIKKDKEAYCDYNPPTNSFMFSTHKDDELTHIGFDSVVDLFIEYRVNGNTNTIKDPCEIADARLFSLRLRDAANLIESKLENQRKE